MPKISVTVTFLRQERAPTGNPLPKTAQLQRVAHCSVAFYRYLYDTVGRHYAWWLRRTLSHDDLAEHLSHPLTSIFVLYRGGEPAGFFELDARYPPVVNIAYFGLMPHAIGQNLGPAMLQAACEQAWAQSPRAVIVNTCTADHPRALNTYLRAGFEIYRRLPELWDIPDHLDLVIDPRLIVP